MPAPFPRDDRESPPPWQDQAVGRPETPGADGHLLIFGEPGAGHDLVAIAIHHSIEWAEGHSVESLISMLERAPRAESPFIAVDCSRIDIEDRLFGSAAGPSGPSAGNLERVERGSDVYAALGGTLVLLQVTELSRRSQTRLARILRDGEVAAYAPGRATVVEPLRLRMIGTVVGHGRDLEVAKLDPDLVKRLSGRTIDVPALRSRRDEIPAIARALLKQICEKMGIAQKSMTGQASELLAALQWRRNLEELSDLLRALARATPAPRIRLSDVLRRVRLDGRAVIEYGGTLKEARARFEKEYVALVLDQHGGSISETARALGLQRTNLYRKIRQLSVDRRRHGRNDKR
jgi:DNA-binding NtrC family response regulator